MRQAALVGVAISLALLVTSAFAAPPAPQTPAAPPAAAPPAAAAPKATAPKAASTPAAAWTGTWTGSLAQVGRAKPFNFSVTLAGKTGKTSYVDDHCTGKLVRVGTSGGYAYFTETITEGKLDPTSKRGCLDGSLTFIKDASGLVTTWMAAHEGKAIVAYGTLAPAK